MNHTPPRAVYDANIYIQALINRAGPAGECVAKALTGEVALFVSDRVLAEIRAAPTKRTPARLGVTPERTQILVENVLKVATLVAVVPQLFSYERDPDDAHYVNIALAASAKLIVSRDRDLLDLTAASGREAVEFRRRFPDLRILDPLQFLRELTAISPPPPPAP